MDIGRISARWWIIVFCLLSLPLRAEQSRCGAREMEARLRATDPVFSDAQTLERQLAEAGLKVECVLASKFASVFDGQKGAALFRTTAGDFEVLFLAEGESFDGLTILQKHASGRYVHSFAGTPHTETTLDGARPATFVQHGNKLFVLWSDELSTKLNLVSDSRCQEQSDSCR